MKKYMLFCFLGFLSVSAFAQQEEQSIEKQLGESMQEMEQELQKLFGDNSQFRLFTDTLFLQDFENMIPQGDMQQLNGEEFGQLFGDMMQMMQQQMQQLTDEDMQQFEKLFEGFDMPMLPAPEQFEEDGKTPKPAEKKKKKRKTYKM